MGVLTCIQFTTPNRHICREIIEIVSGAGILRTLICFRVHCTCMSAGPSRLISTPLYHGRCTGSEARPHILAFVLLVALRANVAVRASWLHLFGTSWLLMASKLNNGLVLWSFGLESISSEQAFSLLTFAYLAPLTFTTHFTSRHFCHAVSEFLTLYELVHGCRRHSIHE